MEDFKGNEINIGDTVAFCKCSSTRTANLFEGTVIKLCNRSGYKCATIEYDEYIGSRKYTFTTTLSKRKILKM